MRLLRTTGLIVLTFIMAACNGSRTSSSSNSPQEVRVSIVTPSGTIVVALDPQHAPKTVENFLHYVDKGFYNGGTFFRAIPGYVIQGGNKKREGANDSPIALEPPTETGIKNTDGAISMARTNDPDSATSEFFIDDGNQPVLDGTGPGTGYAAFGHVISGMNVVRKISHLPTNAEMLLIPVQIVKISRVPNSGKS